MNLIEMFVMCLIFEALIFNCIVVLIGLVF